MCSFAAFSRFLRGLESLLFVVIAVHVLFLTAGS